MSGTLLLVVALALYVTAYFTYGRWISRKLRVSDDEPTPAHAHADGVDYVPSRRSVLLGHHFASIAGVGPIVGPILGATYGWVPAMLWLVLGNILIGAVHDFTVLVTSIRHSGKSIASLAEHYLGRPGKQVFLVFGWFALVLVIAVFTIVVAKTFVAHPEAATASGLFVLLALGFGYALHVRQAPFVPATVVGVILLFASVWAGLRFPLSLPYDAWVAILLGYVFVASVVPVWILLQPRDYLNSFLLYVMLLAGFVGLFFTNPGVQLEPFAGWYDPKLGAMFPILFVTVACGAISGFHSLVASGTTAKQIDRESDAQFIGYGSMLLEGVLAMVALITAIMLTRESYTATLSEAGPVALFSRGLGSFTVTLGVPLAVGTSFAALAISAFALTTLDTSARLGRYTFQEIFEGSRHERWLSNRVVATLITVMAGAALALNRGGTMSIWPVFGAANQMLAALALMTVAAFLSHRAVDNRFVRIPAVVMFVVTLSAIAWLVAQNLRSQNYPLVVVALILAGAACYVAGRSFRRPAPAVAAVRPPEAPRLP